jgi:hypothetical protein
MQKKFFFDKDGNYDPPKTTAAAWQALNAMGATPAEADAILGRMPETAEMTNYFNPTTKQNISSATHPGGNWVESGKAQGAQQPKDTSGDGPSTGQKGAQRDEILRIRNHVDDMADTYGEGSPEHEDAKEVLDLTEELYGVAEDLTSKGVMDSTTMTRAQWDEILSDHTNNGPGGDKKVDWESFNEMYNSTLSEGDAGYIDNAKKFGKWFRKHIVKAVNNPVSAVTLSELGTREEYEAEVRAAYPQINPEDLRDTVNAGEGTKWQS